MCRMSESMVLMEPSTIKLENVENQVFNLATTFSNVFRGRIMFKQKVDSK